MAAMFKETELQKIRGRSKYDDNKNKWIVPYFSIKEKEISLPKVRNAQALIEEQLDKREVIYDDE